MHPGICNIAVKLIFGMNGLQEELASTKEQLERVTSQYSNLAAQQDIASLPSMASAVNSNASAAGSAAAPQLQDDVAAKFCEYQQQLLALQSQLAAEKARADAATERASSAQPQSRPQTRSQSARQRANGATPWPTVAAASDAGAASEAGAAPQVDAALAAETEDARQQISTLSSQLAKKEAQLQRLTNNGSVRHPVGDCVHA